MNTNNVLISDSLPYIYHELETKINEKIKDSNSNEPKITYTSDGNNNSLVILDDQVILIYKLEITTLNDNLAYKLIYV